MVVFYNDGEGVFLSFISRSLYKWQEYTFTIIVENNHSTLELRAQKVHQEYNINTGKMSLAEHNIIA